MTRAIVVAFHKYTPYGGEFYEPILDFFLKSMKEYRDEYDKVYFVDSTWDINPDSERFDKLGNFEVIKVDPSLRYYDAYKHVLREGLIKEDLVLFMDNDMVVYRKNQIESAFYMLEPNPALPDLTYDVVSIYDSIGTYKTDKLNGKNKMCPYWFASKRETLMKYLDVDWSPDAMPYTETFGLLTEAMLNDGLRPYEFEEDKSNCLFDGTQDGEKSKDLGYYHIRAGSTPAYLLAIKKYGNKETYNKYLQNQPRNEYLRQCAWYDYMGGRGSDLWHVQEGLLGMLIDMKVGATDWEKYMKRFKEYHNLP